MQTIKAYLYPNTVEVQVFDPGIFTVRNRQVYSRPIKIHQGIDNPIQVIIRNQDQRKVDLSGYAVQADIQDPVNQITVESMAVVWADITKGLGTFTIQSDVLNQLEQRFYKLTFKLIKTDNNAETPLFIDDNYGVPLDLEVLPAYYSSSQPSPLSNNGILDGGLLTDDLVSDGTAPPTIVDGGSL